MKRPSDGLIENNQSTSVNLLTPEQVSAILQIHVLTVYSYIKQGKLGAIRLGRSYRISSEDLDKFIEINRVKAWKNKLS
jgi:excisionase family DNA binding protein